MSKPRDAFIEELTALITDLKKEQRVTTGPGMDVTIGANAEGWAYQTGDNSFAGDAYLFPNWGIGTLYKDSDPAEFARLLVEDLEANNDAERYFYDSED